MEGRFLISEKSFIDCTYIYPFQPPQKKKGKKLRKSFDSISEKNRTIFTENLTG